VERTRYYVHLQILIQNGSRRQEKNTMADLNQNHVTCPQNRSTATNRSKLSAIWNSPEWKAFVKYHTERVGYCENCKKKENDIAINTDGEEYVVCLTVDHPYRWAYKSKELYLNFEASMCRVVCRTCNSSFERGLDICPECLKAYKQIREPMCRECLFKKHPEAKIAYEKGHRDQRDRQNARNRKKRSKKNPHSCKHRGQDQRCKYRPGMICEHNTKNAPKNKCGHFKARDSKKIVLISFKTNDIKEA